MIGLIYHPQQALLCLIMRSTMVVTGADKEKDCGYIINKPVKLERGAQSKRTKETQT